MFKILDGRAEFYQWDIDRKLVVEDASITEVHFCNRTDNCSLVCEVYEEDGLRVVNVPNILLQTDWRINVYGYDVNYTKHSACFSVVARTQPADYIYKETEVMSFSEVLGRAEGARDGAEAAANNSWSAAIDAKESYQNTKGIAELATREKTKAESAAMDAKLSAANAKASEALVRTERIKAENAAQEARGNAELIVDYVGEIASAIKGKASGEAIELTDISIFPHTLGVKAESKNLIERPYYSETKRGNPYTTSGVTFTANEDGSISLKGAATQWVAYELSHQTIQPTYLKKGVTYTLSAGNGITGRETYLSIKGVSSNKTYNTINGDITFTATEDEAAYMRIIVNGAYDVDGITYYPMLEKNTEATAYTPYISDLSTAKVIIDGSSYTPNEDGTVSGIQSAYPTQTLSTDTLGALVSVEYNRDTNKVIESLVNAIISLGGNV